jgi:hypothetical protein
MEEAMESGLFFFAGSAALGILVCTEAPSIDLFERIATEARSCVEVSGRVGLTTEFLVPTRFTSSSRFFVNKERRFEEIERDDFRSTCELEIGI